MQNALLLKPPSQGGDLPSSSTSAKATNTSLKCKALSKDTQKPNAKQAGKDT